MSHIAPPPQRERQRKAPPTWSSGVVVVEVLHPGDAGGGTSLVAGGRRADLRPAARSRVQATSRVRNLGEGARRAVPLQGVQQARVRAHRGSDAQHKGDDENVSGASHCMKVQGEDHKHEGGKQVVEWANLPHAVPHQAVAARKNNATSALMFGTPGKTHRKLHRKTHREK